MLQTGNNPKEEEEDFLSKKAMGLEDLSNKHKRKSMLQQVCDQHLPFFYRCCITIKARFRGKVVELKGTNKSGRIDPSLHRFYVEINLTYAKK